MGARLFTAYMWSFYVLLFLVFFIIISVTFLLTFWFDPYRIITNRVLGWMAWFMVHPWPTWKITLMGTEHIQKDTPTIFVSNHESFVDIPLIYQLPIRMKWVVKHSMTYIPVMGWMVRLTGQLTINRSKRTAIKKLERLIEPLQSGVPVMLFPEGTRSTDGKLQPFKNGAFLLAMEHGFNIQPMIVEGAFEALRPNQSLFNPVADLKVKVLPSISVDHYESMSELKEYVFKEMVKEKELLEKSTVT